MCSETNCEYIIREEGGAGLTSAGDVNGCSTTTTTTTYNIQDVQTRDTGTSAPQFIKFSDCSPQQQTANLNISPRPSLGTTSRLRQRIFLVRVCLRRQRKIKLTLNNWSSWLLTQHHTHSRPLIFRQFENFPEFYLINLKTRYHDIEYWKDLYEASL